MEFSDTLTLKEIIVGPMSRTKLKELDQIISPNIKGVEIIKARLVFKSYSVIKNNQYKPLDT